MRVESFQLDSIAISIHALREESDRNFHPELPAEKLFLSTPSARRATKLAHPDGCQELISIHALREESDHCNLLERQPADISIHALREESDAQIVQRYESSIDFYPRPPRGERPSTSTRTACTCDFYPRPPRGERPVPCVVADDLSEISIHALREESDLLLLELTRWTTYFYPRPPRGERPSGRIFSSLKDVFLSTPSARRATTTAGWCSISSGFLSTPSARRATCFFLSCSVSHINFYPRPPRGERLLVKKELRAANQKFLSTPSARRATAKTERKHPAFVSLYTSLHKLQRDAYKTNRKITPLLAQTAGIPVRSVPENHVCCRFALAGHQKISTLSWANSGCSPTCSTLVW